MFRIQKFCLKLLCTFACLATSFATAACPSSPLDVSTPPPPLVSASADQSQIGMDDNRNAISIWREFDGTDTYVKSSILPFGGIWSPPVIVSTITGVLLDVTPQIAVNPANGDAVAIWMQSSTTLFTSTLPFGGSWSAPVTLSTIATSSASGGAPQIAINTSSPSNYAVAVWATNTSKIHSAYLSAGVWTTGIQVIPSAGINMHFPKIGIDSSGNALTVYYDSTNKNILSSLLPFGASAWNLADFVNPTPGGILDESKIDLAVAPSGYAIVAYSTDNSMGTNNQVRYQKYISGSWTSQSLASTSTPALEPVVAVDINQNGVIIWSQPNVGRNVRAIYLPFSGGGSSTTLTNNAAGDSSIQPDVSFDVDGNAYATWLTVVGGNDTIQFSRRPFIGGVWSTPNCNVSLAGNNVEFPHIASYAFGYAAINWTNLSTTTIQASIFPASSTINPTSGSTSGGNTVIITGSDFNNITSVEFGPGNFVSFTVLSDTEILVTVPPGSLGSENVFIITSEGISYVAYIYLDPICWQR